MEGESEDLYQIAILIDQLKHDDVQLRVNATRNIDRIASALGPDRTRLELIPFLTESADDEDEVLTILAEKIVDLIPYVGGDEHIVNLLAPLERLACGEESSVRDAALHSIERVVSALPESQLIAFFLPFISRMASKPMSKELKNSRISAAALCHLPLSRLSQQQQQQPLHQEVISELKTLFLRLSRDETPSVRRVVASHFGEMLKGLKSTTITPTSPPASASSSFFSSEFVSAFQDLTKDTQDSVRIQSVLMILALSQILPLEQKVSHLLPVLLRLSQDPSWRVRWALASRMSELARELGAQASLSSLSQCFESLLQDSESEVRVSASSKLGLFCKEILSFPSTSSSSSTTSSSTTSTTSTLTSAMKEAETREREGLVWRLLELSERLISDPSEHVRAALASSLSSLYPYLEGEGLREKLLPMMMEMMKDESSEVQIRVITNLGSTTTPSTSSSTTSSEEKEPTGRGSGGGKLVSEAILPAILRLGSNDNWRVRLSVLSHLPLLIRILSSSSSSILNDDRLSSLSLILLTDDVYSIRRSATEILPQIAELMGSSWIQTQLIPKLTSLLTNDNYLYRVISLYSIGSMLPYFLTKSSPSSFSSTSSSSSSDPVSQLISLLLLGSKDSVANVRLVVTRVLATLHTTPVSSQLSSSTSSSPSSSENKTLFSLIPTQSSQSLLSCLSQLLQDSDRDVRSYANEAMSSLGLTVDSSSSSSSSSSIVSASVSLSIRSPTI